MVSKKCQINGLLLILVTESGYRSNLADFNCEMSQDSILGPLVFYLHKWFTSRNQISEVQHFADDTKPNFDSSENSINKQLSWSWPEKLA